MYTYIQRCVHENWWMINNLSKINVKTIFDVCVTSIVKCCQFAFWLKYRKKWSVKQLNFHYYRYLIEISFTLEKNYSRHCFCTYFYRYSQNLDLRLKKKKRKEITGSFFFFERYVKRTRVSIVHLVEQLTK